MLSVLGEVVHDLDYLTARLSVSSPDRPDSRLQTLLLNELHHTPTGPTLFVGTPDGKTSYFLGFTGDKGFG